MGYPRGEDNLGEESGSITVTSNVTFRMKNTDNNRISIRREVHFYEEINLNEMVPDPEYEDVDVVTDDHPSPVVPRTDQDADGYLKLQGQGNEEHAYQGAVPGNNNEAPLSEDTQGYLRAVPGDDDDTPLSEDTQGYLRSVPDNTADSLEDERHDTQGYLNPVPSSHDAIESKYLTPPLPGATASPYSTPYDHVPFWQKSLRLKINKPK